MYVYVSLKLDRKYIYLDIIAMNKVIHTWKEKMVYDLLYVCIYEFSYLNLQTEIVSKEDGNV